MTGRQLLLADELTTGLGPHWSVRPVGPLPAGDGEFACSADGLVVTPAGRDAAGAARFSDVEIAQDLRWGAFASGPWAAPDDAAPAGMRAEVLLGVLPTGREATGPWPGDVRAGLVTADFGSGLVMDLLLTPDRVVALYERLGPPGAGKAFCYEVTVGRRRPGEWHRCGIELAPDGSVTWLLDGHPVLTVAEPGRTALPEQYLVSGAAPAVAGTTGTGSGALARLAVGLGLFTTTPGAPGVRLRARSLRICRPIARTDGADHAVLAPSSRGER